METMLRVVEEIARLDGAVGWNVMIDEVVPPANESPMALNAPGSMRGK